VTGPVTYRSRERLIELYTQMPEPKVVVAFGSCTCTGGVFRDMYKVEDGIDRYIPVDVYVPGCAASPELLIDGLVKALDILQVKTKEMEKPFKLFKESSSEDGIVSRRDNALKVGDTNNDKD
jgi:ech hydrogenase subunit C